MSNLSETSQAIPSALPNAWINRLFDRFLTMYGRQWLDLWAGVPLEAVKATWAEDLAAFDADTLRKALEHCRSNNKFPPSSPEFVGLCKSFRPSPAGHYAALPAPRGGDIDPRVRAEIAKFLEVGRKSDPKDWARRILTEAKDGTYRYPHGINCAEQALGLRPL